MTITAAAAKQVSLSASPNPVFEGQPVSVTARLSAAVSYEVAIPLTVTRNTAEAGDIGALSSLTIPAGSTSSTGTIATNPDSDEDDETFTVALGTLPLRSEFPIFDKGSPSSVRVTVIEPAKVTLSASPTQVWEGKASRVTATLSRALPHGVLIPVTVTPCPTGSWCKRWNNYGIHIVAGSTVGHLKGPVDPSAVHMTTVVVDGGHDNSGRFHGTTQRLYAGPQTSLLTVRDTNAESEEVTVALGSKLPRGVIAGSKTSQKIKVLDPDGFAMTLTADRQPAEGGGVVKVTVDLGQPAPPGFYAKINSSASTAKFGHGLDRTSRPDWTMDGKVGIEEPYVAAGPVLPRSTSSTRGPCSRYSVRPPKRCVAYISADDWNNRDWQRMHYLKDWNGASRKTFTIKVADDDFVDPGETIVLQGIGYIYAWGVDHGGSGFPKGQVQSNELRLTIKDNDGATAADDPILMGALDTTARESGTGADTRARVQVWLSRPATQDVTVSYTTADGTATAGQDYTAVSGTLTFAAGETREEVEVVIKDDGNEDSGETFLVRLSSPTPASGVRLSDAEATVTIINDEADLDGLKLWGAPDAGGPYARLDLGAFDGAVTDYAVTVPHGTTHAKLLGTSPREAYLTLKAGRAGSELAAVRNNVAGPAVPLAVGDTVLAMQATAPSGARQTYRVTVTREERKLSPDATLSALAAEGAPGADGTWTALDLGTFASATTSYSATVPYGTTHARLTATAADANATLKAGAGSNLSAAASGTASAAIALQAGANALSVEVTAEDGTVKTYAVTVTREAAEAAVAVTLSATPNPVREGAPVTVTATLAEALEEDVTVPLAVTRGTSEDGDHGSLASIALLAGFTSATGTVSTVEDDDGDDETFTVALGSLPSGLVAGTASTVEVTIADSGLQRAAPAPPANLKTGQHGGALLVDGTPASGASGYDLHYTSAAADEVADSAAASGSDPSAAWVADPHFQDYGPATPSVAIHSLPRGKTYRVRVRSKNAGGDSAWAFVSGTLVALPTVGFELGSAVLSESGTEPTAFKVRLSEALAKPVTVRIAVMGGYKVLPGVANHLDYTLSGARVDPRSPGSRYRSLAFGAGETEKAFTVLADADRKTEGSETLVLGLERPAPGDGGLYALGRNDVIEIAIRDDSTQAEDDPAPDVEVSLFVVSRIAEGRPVDVVAELNAPAPAALAIPVTVSSVGGGPYATPMSISVPIARGETSGAHEVRPGRDDDDRDELLVFSLGAVLPEGVVAVSPVSRTTLITDHGRPAPPPGAVAVSLDVPTRVSEGRSFKVRAELNAPASAALAIPVTVSSVDGGPYATPAEISVPIALGETVGTRVVRPEADDDDRDEKLVFSLGQVLPEGVVADGPVSVSTVISDSGQPPAAVAVSLSATPNPVLEGSPVTVRATLAEALPEDVTIPLTVTRGTSEDGDHGSHASITLPSGVTSLTGTVTTVADDDGDHETFTVALGRLPSGLVAGSASSVEVKIHDRGAPPTASLRGAPAEHDGETPFTVHLQLSESLDSGSRLPSAASFVVKGGSVESVRRFRPYLYWVRVRPKSRHDVTVTLEGGRACGEAGAICTADGRSVSNAPTLAVAGPDGPLSSDATLSGLSAEAKTEDGWTALGIGTFATATTSYSATVSHGTTHARLTATAADANATLKAGLGSSLSAAASGTASGAIALQAGANALSVEVTAEDGTVQTYAVTVTREAAPAAVAVTLSATPNPVREGSPVTVRATLAEALEEDVTVPLAVTRGTSEDGDHGSLASIALPAGFTSAAGTVSTAEDADGEDETFTVALGSLPSGLVAGTTSTVEVTIADSELQRTAPPALGGLSGSTSTDGSDFGGTLDIGTFAPGTTEYAATVGNAVTHVKLTATAGEPGATLKVGTGSSLAAVADGSASGAIALSVGANALKVEVTAEDGTVQTYAVTVTREERALSPDATLSALAAEAKADGTWSTLELGTFASATTAYAATVPNGTTHVRLTATAADANATLKAGAGSSLAAVASGSASGAIALSVGANALKVEATAEDGTVQTYAVTVTREERALSPDATLSALAAEAKTEDGWSALDVGTFATATTAYSATVPHGTTHVRLTATAADANATLKAGAGSSLAAVASGTASGAIALSVGANALKVEVTAEDGTVRTYAVAVTRQAAPLTAAFENVPAEHDGTAFTFGLTLSEAPGAGSLPAAASFKVGPGTASVSGSGTRYAVTVTPKPANAWKDVTITLKGGRACNEEGAICTADGRALSNTSSVTVSGPVRIRIAGAKAHEGKDASLDFAVTLNRAAAHEVSVDYATADETATAGLDYTATSGTLVFAAGVTERTVSVPVLDDSVDEGKEVMRLLLSNPKGAYLRGVHAKARGIIINHDPLPGAWLSRFGRTVAGLHVAAIRDRLAADSGPGLTARFAGQPLSRPQGGVAQAADADGMKTSTESRVARGASAADAELSSRTASGDAGALAETDGDETLAFRSLLGFLTGDGDGNEASVQAVSADDVLLGTDFLMTRDAGSGLSHGFWGRAARSGFSGREGETSVEGSVTGVLLGTDWKRKGMAFGVIVSESRGSMTYGGASSGAIDARLSALVPWAGLEIGEHSSLWGAAGIGRGDMTLRPDGQGRTVTGIGWSMAALGAEGALAPGARLGGASLGWHADALATRAESDAARTDTGNLAAGSGATTRMRLGLRAAWQRTLASGATLAPRLEAGVRHDGGDAETGIGLEVGGGIAFVDPARGLSMSMDARTLALHEDGNFRDWGLSLGFSWDPRPETKRGCSATAQHGLGGASAGGVDALLGPEAFPGAPGAQGGSGWSVEAACGTGRGRGMVGSPYARASGGGEADSLRVGYRIEPDADHAKDAAVQAWADPSADGGSVGAGLEWRW